MPVQVLGPSRKMQLFDLKKKKFHEYFLPIGQIILARDVSLNQKGYYMKHLGFTPQSRSPIVHVHALPISKRCMLF